MIQDVCLKLTLFVVKTILNFGKFKKNDKYPKILCCYASAYFCTGRFCRFAMDCFIFDKFTKVRLIHV